MRLDRTARPSKADARNLCHLSDLSAEGAAGDDQRQEDVQRRDRQQNLQQEIESELTREGTVILPLDTSAAPIPVADFLAGLRTAWRMGEVRPTAQPALKPKRGRRRPDPLIAVTDDLRSWFEADPTQTGGQLLLRLQTSDPDRYPDALLRSSLPVLSITHTATFACPTLKNLTP